MNKKPRRDKRSETQLMIQRPMHSKATAHSAILSASDHALPRLQRDTALYSLRLTTHNKAARPPPC